MKQIVLALSLIMLSQGAFAAFSCSELQAKKDAYTAEINYLRGKISNARNSDLIDLYMDQYEALYDRYQAISKAIDDQCK